MRKKTLLFIADRLIWMVILLLPLLMLLFSYFGYQIQDSSVSLKTLSDVFSEIGLSDNNFIYSTINDLFGTGGSLELFTTGSSILFYFSYFVIVELMHLFLDVILFLPRLARKYLDKGTCEVEVDGK